MGRVINMKLLSILGLISTAPKPLKFVFDGLLEGTVGVLAAAGGSGKSFFALQLACQIASGSEITGFTNLQKGKVIYLSLEDSATVIHNRISSFVNKIENKDELIKNLNIFDFVGDRFNINNQNENFNEVMQLAVGAKLVIIDTLSRAHDYDENSNNQMSELLLKLEKLSAETGASFLLLHHVNKTAGGTANTAAAARGASSLIDNARYACSLKVEKEGTVEFESTKMNHAKKKDKIVFTRGEGGHLIPV